MLLNVCALIFIQKKKNEIGISVKMIDYFSIIILKYRLVFFHFGFGINSDLNVFSWG